MSHANLTSRWTATGISGEADSDTGDLNFLNVKEDDFGYASATWTLPSIEFDYEVRLRSICEDLPTAPSRLLSFSSDPISVLVDRTPPSVVGVPQPSANLFP